MSILSTNYVNQTVKKGKMAKISRLGSKIDLTRLKSTWEKFDLTRLDSTDFEHYCRCHKMTVWSWPKVGNTDQRGACRLH